MAAVTTTLWRRAFDALAHALDTALGTDDLDTVFQTERAKDRAVLVDLRRQQEATPPSIQRPSEEALQ